MGSLKLERTHLGCVLILIVVIIFIAQARDNRITEAKIHKRTATLNHVLEVAKEIKAAPITNPGQDDAFKMLSDHASKIGISDKIASIKSIGSDESKGVLFECGPITFSQAVSILAVLDENSITVRNLNIKKSFNDDSVTIKVEALNG